MITVTPLSLQELYVGWSGIDGDYFEVYRSNSPQDFELVCTHTVFPFFVDSTVNLHDPSIHYYYKVKSYIGGVLAKESEATPVMNQAGDRIALKVIHEARIALRVMNNPIVHVLIKKREGIVCPECWNPITNKTRFANCSVCNGTGKIFGYYPSVPIRISQNVSQLVDMSNMMDGENVGLTPVDAWVLNRPLLSPGDVIVDVLNLRYKVEQVTRRTKSQYVIRQLLQLYPLPKGHPAYNAKVDTGVMLIE